MHKAPYKEEDLRNTLSDFTQNTSIKQASKRLKKLLFEYV